MIYLRLLVTVFCCMTAIYYLMIVGHLFGVWKMTRRTVTFAKLCIPFYYWAVSQNNKNKKCNPKKEEK